MQELVEKVTEKVSKSPEVLKAHHSELANSLVSPEQKVDGLYFAHLEQLSKTRGQNVCVNYNLLVSRYIERLADHATYVGEAGVNIANWEKISLR